MTVKLELSNKESAAVGASLLIFAAILQEQNKKDAEILLKVSRDIHEQLEQQGEANA